MSKQLSGVGLKLDGGPVNAEYRWSRGPDLSTNHHGVTLKPRLYGGLSVRARVDRAFDRRGGADGLSYALDTGLTLDGLRSKVTLLQDSRGAQHVAGADLQMDASLLGDVLSARLAHGEWRLEQESGSHGRRVRSALGLRYESDGTRLSADFAQRLEADTAGYSTYSAGALLPLRHFGLMRHSAELKVELVMPRDGDVRHSFSLTEVYRGPRGRRIAGFAISESASGLRQAVLKLSRIPYRDLKLNSAISLESGTGAGDALVSLSAEYGF
ncbi:MAG: hypothetical protein K9L70_06200 [Thiohalocapsa sp.]|nr:hypothetical protein [Thiohalocapsa sp.]MCF7989927.1 hypothetical protein [Thiohalocapsa sp.]